MDGVTRFRSDNEKQFIPSYERWEIIESRYRLHPEETSHIEEEFPECSINDGYNHWPHMSH